MLRVCIAVGNSGAGKRQHKANNCKDCAGCTSLVGAMAQAIANTKPTNQHPHTRSAQSNTIAITGAGLDPNDCPRLAETRAPALEHGGQQKDLRRHWPAMAESRTRASH